MRFFMQHRLAQAVGLAAIFGLSACAGDDGKVQLPTERVVGGGTAQMTDVRPVPGFLPQPGLLQPGGKDRAALYYMKPGANFATYRSIYLAPVEIWAGADSKLKDVPATQRRALANLFYSNLHNALKPGCTLVSKPAANTLRIRIALADASSADATKNTVANYAPYASTAYTLGSLAFNKGVGFFAGTATVEGFAADARTGEVLWQAVDKRGGTGALVKNTLDEWLDVRHAFEAWSAQVAQRLRDIGVCNRG